MCDKVVLITGANRGIGLAFVQVYINKNYHVIACARSIQKAKELLHLQKQHPKQLTLLTLNATDAATMQSLATELKDQPIDILINNAGVFPNDKTIENSSWDTWINTLMTNTVAPASLIQCLLNNINRGQQKIIVNISSIMGSFNKNDDGGYITYRTSKTALNAITKDLGNQLKDKKIKIVALDPGWVKTDMGGTDANLTPKQSALAMTNIIDQLTLNHSGKFYTHTGQELPW